jgi:hypothetical protein
LHNKEVTVPSLTRTGTSILKFLDFITDTRVMEISRKIFIKLEINDNPFIAAFLSLCFRHTNMVTVPNSEVVKISNLFDVWPVNITQ